MVFKASNGLRSSLVFSKLQILLSSCLLSLATGVWSAEGALPQRPAHHQAPSASHQPALLQLNFHQADIRAVIALISKMTHKSFLIDPRVQGRITLVSSHPMGTDEAYQAFLSMLQVLNYAVVPSGGIDKVVPSVDAKGEGLPVGSVKHPGKGDEMLVRVVQVHHISVDNLVPILRPMMQDTSTLNAYPASNAIIMAGTARSINRLLHTVKQLDADNAGRIHVVPLKHANAAQVQEAISQLQSSDRVKGQYVDATVVADTESNSLLLHGSAQGEAGMLDLIHRMDAKAAQNDTQQAQVVALNYLKAKDLAPVLQKMFSSGGDKSQQNTIHIIAEDTTNTLLLNAPVNVLQNIMHIIKELDKRPQQVLVEAIIAEVDQNSASDLGIEWGTVGSGSSGGADGTGSDTVSSGIAGFNPGIGMLPHTSIRAVAYALEAHANSNILSTPMISVINNKEAKLSDGKSISTENREYATTDTGGTAGEGGVPFNTYEYKKVQLSLKVTPQISPNGMVNLKIDQENDSLEPGSSGSSDAGNPNINTSDINTYVMVHSGDVLVMGGLMKQDQTGTVKAVPILGRLPVIGHLFKHKIKDADKKDLLVFIRPIILNNRKTSRMITKRKYDYMRNEEYRRDRGKPLAGTQHGPYLSHYPGTDLPTLPSPFSSQPVHDTVSTLALNKAGYRHKTHAPDADVPTIKHAVHAKG